MAMHWGNCRFPLLLMTLAMTGFFGDVFGNPMPKHVQQIRATNQTHMPINDPKSGKLDPAARENTHVKSRADILGGTLKRLLRKLKEADDPRLELVFLVDSSASVGAEHFFNEIRFVRKLLSDFTVSNNAVRVALVTFSSRNRVIRHIDHLSPHSSRHKNNKCNLMQEEFPRITYTGGGTYTLGAMLEAEAILRHARRGVRRAVFLITDGYSNGGDPRPVAQRLKEMRSSRGSRKNHEDGADKEEGNDGRKSSKNNQYGVEIFTFGIKNGNTEELLAMATDKEHTFIVGSFKEFEALGRRAFHQDLQTGSFLPVNSTLCNNLCTLGNYTNGSGDSHQNHCCDIMGECACGTVSGHYSCICPPGHYGTGLINDCHPCPMGTYNPGGFPGDMHLLCRRCPDPNHITKKTGATSADQCICGEGYVSSNERSLRCIAITCPPLTPPLNGYFTRMISGKRSGGRRLGRANRERKNGINRRMQSGSRDACPNLTFKSTCGVRCKTGFVLIGSHIRTCGPNGNWTGHDASCVIKRCPPLQHPKDGTIQCEQKLGSLKGNASMQLGPKDGFLPNTVCRFDCNSGYHLVGSTKRTCLPNGIWDGLQVYCKAKSCPSLQSLPHGKVFPPICVGRQHHSLIITSCLLVCNPGYVLWGVRDRLEWETNQGKLICGPDGNWELTTTEIASTKEALAWQRGKWNGGRCVDIEPPTLNCPGNVSVETDENKKFATVYWDQPIANDNSGIPVTLTAIPAISWPAKLPIGDNEVTIVARDANRNKAECKFIISVRDMQPPTVHACVTPPPFILPSEPITQSLEPKSDMAVMAHGLTWDKPVFEDNSGDDVSVQVKAQISGRAEAMMWQGLDGGQGEVFPVGDTTIQYTAFDSHGNNNTCEITITIKEHACPEFPGPINGNSNCSRGRKKDSTSFLCTLTCSDGYAFPVSTPQEYFCSSTTDTTVRKTISTSQFKLEQGSTHDLLSHDSLNAAMGFHEDNNAEFISWEPRDLLPFSDCMVAAIPNTLQQDGLIFMDGDNSICSDSVSFQQVEDKIRKEISEKLAEICGTGSTGLQCEIVGDIEKVCDNFPPTPEKEVNVAMASSVSRKSETHEGKEREGGRARHGRRSGSGRGTRKRKLRDEVQGKRRRGGAKEGGKERGEERRRGGRRRDQRGGRREGRRKNTGEVGGGRRDGEEQPRRTKTPAGTKAPPVSSATEVLPHINRTRRSVNEDSTELDSFESSTRDSEKRGDEDDYEYEESEESDNQGKSQGIGIYFKMVGKLSNGTQKNQTENMTALRSLMEKVQQTLVKAVNRGDFDIKVPMTTNASSDRESTIVMKELSSSIGFDDPQSGCDKGSAMVNDLCVKCPPGTYWDDFNEDCVVCEKGSYQPLEGQSFCLRCPDGYSTNFGIRSRNRRKATSIKDCIAECKPGTHSVDGLFPCSTCPKGYYTPQRGTLNCTKCPENKTTTARGAIKDDECKDICHSGTVSETGAMPCYACPSGYFQNNPGKTYCVKSSCIKENCTRNSFSAAKFIENDEDGHEEILPFNDCFTLPCVNGGTCITLANSGVFCSCAAGFMGSFCESQEDMCASEPCLNDGECSSNGITFNCSCPEGFTGLNCESMTDPCSSNSCLNNGICVANDTSFECLCLAGFEGIYCEREVCHSPPCNLNDSCVFNGEDWECMCGDDSSEDECTAEEVQRLEAQMWSENEEPIDILPNSVLHFPKSSTSNYILVTGNMDKNYTRVTLCGWINTKDRSNYGTVFSLATQDSANAFVLTDYSGFVLYVGGNSAVTDVSANDGKWHHFCFTWASQNGKWQLFLDGILAANGENLSSNYAISGQSTIVIGQEQDWIGGGFSGTESFVGRMAMITLENNIITPEEAFQRAALCKSGDRRFLIWDWADFLAEIHGNIEVESSNLCQKCTTPPPPKNGKVVLLENKNNSIEDETNGGLIIKYICHTGFTISKGHEMRWCLSNGTWDGKQPSCKRASCETLEVELQTGANKVIDSTLPIKCKGRKKANEFKEVNETDGNGQFHNQYSNNDGGSSYIEATPPSITNETFLTGNVNDSSIKQDNKETDLDTEDLVASNEDTVSSEIKTKCLGPLGIGKLNNEWTSYSEAHNLLNGQENNYSNQKQFLFTYGTKLDISCDFGFELNGANHIVCSLNGLWRKRTNYAASDINDTISHRENSLEEGEIVLVPSCSPVKCGSPPDIHQGEWELMERKRWNKGEGLKWQRVSGGLGHEEIDIPNTFANTSKDINPNQPSNPEYAEEEFKFGDVAEYDCEYGYALIGPQSLHCSGDGSWTWSSRNSRWPGLEYAPRYYPPHKWPHNNDNPHAQQPINKAPRPPVCLPVRCPTPPPPLNGGFVYRKDTSKPRARNNHSDNSESSEAYYVGDEVLNTCKDEDQLVKASLKRRQLVGPRLRRCLPSGQWSSYRPRCRDL